MLNFNNIMIGSADPKKMAGFYEKVFSRKPDWTDGSWSGWSFGGFSITIGEHSEVSGKAREPQRIILNLETDDVKGEFARIKDAGAAVVKEPYTMPEWESGMIATFADPDGNYFQLMTPWKNE